MGDYAIIIAVLVPRRMGKRGAVRKYGESIFGGENRSQACRNSGVLQLRAVVVVGLPSIDIQRIYMGPFKKSACYRIVPMKLHTSCDFPRKPTSNEHPHVSVDTHFVLYTWHSPNTRMYEANEAFT